ncbi:MAG: hypothetical protein L6R42_005040 [Xanthoria sp. 1 TBL-2021]|nr:MAG: hypothetical protein L6R42_005040 [Xanthoria sp. 1 TBL-2021]
MQAGRPEDYNNAGIEPISCHSHNDYERQVPLYDALNVGCISIEADIWLQGGDLLIGHTEDSLDRSRTLKSLYLDPLTSIVGDRNPDVDLIDGKDHSGSLKGIFTANSSVSLVLLVDIKTDSADTLPVLRDQLVSLRKQGILTHFDGTRTIHGPITVVGTGNTNFDTITHEKDRAIFFDAPLEESSTDSNLYNKDNSYYASVSFEKAIGKPSLLGDLSDEQIKKVKDQIQGAHSNGLKVRYWDTPGWPAGEKIWGQLWKEGVDVLNADDLKKAKDFLEKESKIF